MSGDPAATRRRQEPAVSPPRFCVRCGARLGRRKVEGRMREACRECGHVAFRNAKPAAGVLVERGGEVLLVKRGTAPYLGWWDIPGGFLEEDEDPERGAVREVREGTGLRVKVDSLLGVYLGGYRGTRVLNVYYRAHETGGRERPGDDAAELRWFRSRALPGRLAFPDHTGRVIRDWRALLRTAMKESPQRLPQGVRR